MNEANPYLPPTQAPTTQPPSEPGNPLQIPAICLLVFSGLHLFGIMIALPGLVVDWTELDLSTSRGMGELTGGVVAVVIWVAVILAIIFGAICMIRLRGFRQAQVAAILAIIPICSPCYIMGIPFGIWALVQLNSPAVRGRFTD